MDTTSPSPDYTGVIEQVTKLLNDAPRDAAKAVETWFEESDVTLRPGDLLCADEVLERGLASHLEFAAAIGALRAVPGAFALPVVVIQMMCGRYDEALVSVARHVERAEAHAARLAAAADDALRFLDALEEDLVDPTESVEPQEGEEWIGPVLVSRLRACQATLNAALDSATPAAAPSTSTPD